MDYLKKETLHLSQNIDWEPLLYVKVTVILESRAAANLSQILSRGALTLTSWQRRGARADLTAQCTVATRFLVAALSTRPGQKPDTAASGLREQALEMASRKVWTKEETMHLISLYKSCPAVWDNQHVHYKDREKRNTCWNSMGEAMNTTSAEVQRKIHNLRNQVSATVCCKVTQT